MAGIDRERLEEFDLDPIYDTNGVELWHGVCGWTRTVTYEGLATIIRYAEEHVCR